MKLPNAAEAFVPPEKLTDYLLALTHPVGGSKARFFRTHGFDEINATELADGLLTIVRTAEVEVVENPHGTKYVADGDLPTPRGTTVRIRTVWIVEPDEPRPRFVSAYPLA